MSEQTGVPGRSGGSIVDKGIPYYGILMTKSDPCKGLGNHHGPNQPI